MDLGKCPSPFFSPPPLSKKKKKRLRLSKIRQTYPRESGCLEFLKTPSRLSYFPPFFLFPSLISKQVLGKKKIVSNFSQPFASFFPFPETAVCILS